MHTLLFTVLQILGKLTSLNINGHSVNKLLPDDISDGYYNQHLEYLRITNGVLEDIELEFLQVLPLIIGPINEKIIMKYAFQKSV